MAAGERGRALVERVLASVEVVCRACRCAREKVVGEALDLLGPKMPKGSCWKRN